MSWDNENIEIGDWLGKSPFVLPGDPSSVPTSLFRLLITSSNTSFRGSDPVLCSL